jgi:phosphoribosylaminoimidazolecarboxamide formyltransferase/IMP cyclohydrolase
LELLRHFLDNVRVVGRNIRLLSGIFLEVVVAADFDEAAREVFEARSALRLLQDTSLLEPNRGGLELRSAGGAVLVAEADDAEDDPSTWTTATKQLPTEQELADLDFAWRMVRHVKSNAIVLAHEGALVGVGAGQTSRVDSAEIAVRHAGQQAVGAVCASDAFFPFADAVDACLNAGVRAFIQPGGSKRDDEVVAAVDAAGGTMLFTGKRHFRH